MAILHRIQWIDSQIRAGRYPNAGDLAEAFEISHRQALRDFAYLRDSLGAPLTYSAQHRGYTYSADCFTPPGPYLTEADRAVLSAMAIYYRQVSAQERPGAPIYGQLADLLKRIGGPHSVAEARAQAATKAPVGLLPYQALLRQEGPPAVAIPPSLQPYWRGEAGPGLGTCEFSDPAAFVTALLAAGPVCRVERPTWLRRRLQISLRHMLQLNGDMTSPVTPSSVPLVQEPELAKGYQHRGDLQMTGRRCETTARMHGSWLSYIGAAYGACRAAGLCDLDFIDAYGQSGMGFHFIVHEACCPSSVTVYDWMGTHAAALDRLGILSEVYVAMPGSRTYEAACRRAVVNIKAAIDRGMPVVLWGVDSEDFGLVYGYDDADGVLLISGIFGQGEEGSLPILYENLGRTSAAAPILHYQVPLERVAVDPVQSRWDSLAEYVRRMERPGQNGPAYFTGLAAYDAWIQALARPDLNQRGLRYLVYVYHETKDFAAAYMHRLAESLGVDGLSAMADGFQGVSDCFEEMMKVLGQQYSPPPILDEPVTPAQRTALDGLLREARARETHTVDLVKRVLAKRPQ